jgi:hypothetical protein
VHDCYIGSMILDAGGVLCFLNIFDTLDILLISIVLLKKLF